MRMKSHPRLQLLTVACAFVIAMALYAISYFVLWQGYKTLPAPGSETGPQPMDPMVLPLSVLGLSGIWLARSIPILPWLWLACLAFWTYWNVRYSLEGRLVIDGRHGCVLCEDGVVLLFFATLGWLFVAFVAWLFTRTKRLIA
jgi:hypothetical protein